MSAKSNVFVWIIFLIIDFANQAKGSYQKREPTGHQGNASVSSKVAQGQSTPNGQYQQLETLVIFAKELDSFKHRNDPTHNLDRRKRNANSTANERVIRELWFNSLDRGETSNIKPRLTFGNMVQNRQNHKQALEIVNKTAAKEIMNFMTPLFRKESKIENPKEDGVSDEDIILLPPEISINFQNGQENEVIANPIFRTIKMSEDNDRLHYNSLPVTMSNPLAVKAKRTLNSKNVYDSYLMTVVKTVYPNDELKKGIVIKPIPLTTLDAVQPYDNEDYKGVYGPFLKPSQRKKRRQRKIESTSSAIKEQNMRVLNPQPDIADNQGENIKLKRNSVYEPFVMSKIQHPQKYRATDIKNQILKSITSAFNNQKSLNRNKMANLEDDFKPTPLNGDEQFTANENNLKDVKKKLVSRNKQNPYLQMTSARSKKTKNEFNEPNLMSGSDVNSQNLYTSAVEGGKGKSFYGPYIMSQWKNLPGSARNPINKAEKHKIDDGKPFSGHFLTSGGKMFSKKKFDPVTKNANNYNKNRNYEPYLTAFHKAVENEKNNNNKDYYEPDLQSGYKPESVLKPVTKSSKKKGFYGAYLMSDAKRLPVNANEFTSNKQVNPVYESDKMTRTKYAPVAAKQKKENNKRYYSPTLMSSQETAFFHDGKRTEKGIHELMSGDDSLSSNEGIVTEKKKGFYGPFIMSGKKTISPDVENHVPQPLSGKNVQGLKRKGFNFASMYPDLDIEKVPPMSSVNRNVQDVQSKINKLFKNVAKSGSVDPMLDDDSYEGTLLLMSGDKEELPKSNARHGNVPSNVRLMSGSGLSKMLHDDPVYVDYETYDDGKLQSSGEIVYPNNQLNKNDLYEDMASMETDDMDYEEAIAKAMSGASENTIESKISDDIQGNLESEDELNNLDLSYYDQPMLGDDAFDSTIYKPSGIISKMNPLEYSVNFNDDVYNAFNAVPMAYKKPFYSKLALKPMSGYPRRAKFLRGFSTITDGSKVFNAFEDQYDPGFPIFRPVMMSGKRAKYNKVKSMPVLKDELEYTVERLEDATGGLNENEDRAESNPEEPYQIESDEARKYNMDDLVEEVLFGDLVDRLSDDIEEPETLSANTMSSKYVEKDDDLSDLRIAKVPFFPRKKSASNSRPNKQKFYIENDLEKYIVDSQKYFNSRNIESEDWVRNDQEMEDNAMSKFSLDSKENEVDTMSASNVDLDESKSSLSTNYNPMNLLNDPLLERVSFTAGEETNSKADNQEMGVDTMSASSTVDSEDSKLASAANYNPMNLLSDPLLERVSFTKDEQTNSKEDNLETGVDTMSASSTVDSEESKSYSEDNYNPMNLLTDPMLERVSVTEIKQKDHKTGIDTMSASTFDSEEPALAAYLMNQEPDELSADEDLNSDEAVSNEPQRLAENNAKNKNFKVNSPAIVKTPFYKMSLTDSLKTKAAQPNREKSTPITNYKANNNVQPKLPQKLVSQSRPQENRHVNHRPQIVKRPNFVIPNAKPWPGIALNNMMSKFRNLPPSIKFSSPFQRWLVRKYIPFSAKSVLGPGEGDIFVDWDKINGNPITDFNIPTMTVWYNQSTTEGDWEKEHSKDVLPFRHSAEPSEEEGEEMETRDQASARAKSAMQSYRNNLRSHPSFTPVRHKVRNQFGRPRYVLGPRRLQDPYQFRPIVHPRLTLIPRHLSQVDRPRYPMYNSNSHDQFRYVNPRMPQMYHRGNQNPTKSLRFPLRSIFF